MNSNFDLWCKACKEFDEYIWKVTSNPEDAHGVYMTIKEYFPPGEYNTMRETMFHLWWNGKQEVCSKNGSELIHVFRDRYNKEHKESAED